MIINILIKTQIFKVSKKWTVGVKKMDSCKLSFSKRHSTCFRHHHVSKKKMGIGILLHQNISFALLKCECYNENWRIVQFINFEKGITKTMNWV